MSVNLDMDIGSLVKSIFKKGEEVQQESQLDSPKTESPYKKTILAGVAILLFFGAFMAGVYSPYHNSTVGKRSELMEKQDKQAETAKIEAESKALEQELVATKDHYRDLLEYFGDYEDIGYLYESVSNLAVANNLVVINVKETGKTSNKVGKNETNVRESGVEIELQGKYNSYMAFKEALAGEKALLDIQSENIKVIKDEVEPGKISAKLKILVYTIDKEPFRKLLANIKNINEFAHNE